MNYITIKKDAAHAAKKTLLDLGIEHRFFYGSRGNESCKIYVKASLADTKALADLI